MPIARTWGGISLNDRVNTFTDTYIPPYNAANKYEQVVGGGGEAVAVRIDQKAATPQLSGYFVDTVAYKFQQFITDMESLSFVQLDLGQGWKWAHADVVDVSMKRHSVFVDGSGNFLERWAITIKFQCYTANRIP